MRSKLAIIFCLFFYTACSNAALLQISFKNPGGASSPKIEVETALKNSTRLYGMMYRKKMEASHGMLFIFPRAVQRSFWMRNTYLALDIIFIDSDRKVLNVVENATPLTDTPRSSEGAAKYVVEVNAGLAKTWGIVKGSILEGELPESLD